MGGQSAEAVEPLLAGRAEQVGETGPVFAARCAGRAMAEPHEVVRLVAGLAGGSIVVESDEPAVDDNDVVAALTLLPGVRADLDATELQLLTLARGRGMTWQDIAFGLGLNTPQAARQRFERLEARADG